MLRFVRATDADVPEVLAVLDDAAGRLAAAGVRQWPRRFAAEWVAPSVGRGETWLVRSAGRAPGQRADGGTRTLVSRYERRL